jgi:hypothetical protein
LFDSTAVTGRINALLVSVDDLAALIDAIDRLAQDRGSGA